MANGDVRKIPNTNRIVVEADNLGYVLEVPSGVDHMDVVADFMAAWRIKSKRDRLIIASRNKQRREKEAKKRGVAINLLEGLTDAEIDELAKEERKPMRFAFDGFNTDAEAVQAPGSAVPPKKGETAPEAKA